MKITLAFTFIFIIGCGGALPSPTVYPDPSTINGDFEAKTKGWESSDWNKGLEIYQECPNGACSMAGKCGHVSNGKNSLQINPQYAESTMVSEAFRVNPESTYSFGFWKQNLYHEITMYVHWFGVDGELIGSDYLVAPPKYICQGVSYCGECTDYAYGSLKSPSGVTHGKVEFRFKTVVNAYPSYMDTFNIRNILE